MENLKRYDCDFDQCGIMDNGMIPNPKGAYVKFSELEVALRSASDNTTNSAIAIVDKYLATKNITAQEKEVIKLFRYWLTQQH